LSRRKHQRYAHAKQFKRANRALEWEQIAPLMPKPGRRGRSSVKSDG
jgi:hypothetical protein